MACSSAFYIWPSGQSFFNPTTGSNSTQYQFDPVPLIDISITWERNQNGDRLTEKKNYTLSGTILANKGVNVPSGALSGLENIDKQQDVITNAMGIDRGQFIVFDQNGYIVINETPNVNSLSFEQGVWVNISRYVLELESENPVGAGASGVKSASETWTIEQNEDGTVSISHTATATGTATATEDAFTNAKNFILAKTGQNPLIQGFFIDLAGKSAFDHSKQEEVSRDDGVYSISETWLAHDQSFIDDRQIQITFERNDLGSLIVAESGITGTVTGFSTTDDPSPSGRFQAASDAFENIIKAEIGFDDPALVTTKQQTNNLLAGTVGYSISRSPDEGGNEFENRSRTVTLDRNEDGTTRETVTASAKIKQSSTKTVDDAIAFTEANVFAEDSTLPPFSASGSFIVSRGREKNEFEKSASLTIEYLDAGDIDFVEDYSVEVTDDLTKTSVSITGNIQGLGEESTVTSTERFTRALNAWETTIQDLRFPRCQAATSGTLNIKPLSETFGEARNLGQITYGATFDDRETLPSGVVDETVKKTFSGGDAVFALIAIPGRSNDGPIGQDMDTITAVNLNVSVTQVFEKDVTESQRITSVCDRAKIAFGGILPTGVPIKENLTIDDKNRSMTLTLTATLIGSAIDLSWRCS